VGAAHEQGPELVTASFSTAVPPAEVSRIAPEPSDVTPVAMPLAETMAVPPTPIAVPIALPLAEMISKPPLPMFVPVSIPSVKTVAIANCH